MIKKHGIFVGIAVLLATAMFIVTGCPTDSGDDEDISWTVSGGDYIEGESTAKLIFTFDEDVSGLKAADIVLTNEGGAATKGDLTGSGKIWELAVTPSKTGTIMVRITKTGIQGRTWRQSIYFAPKVRWTQAYSPFGSSTSIYCVAYGGGKFVAGGEGGKMAYSADGVSWTVVDTTFYANDITYGSDKFVAVGSAAKMAYSADGVTWTTVDTTFSAFYGVAYGGGKFVAVGFDSNGGASMTYSSDGVTWTGIQYNPLNNDTSYHFRDITYGGGKFVAVGNRFRPATGNQGLIVYSEDGITWDSGTLSGSGFSDTIWGITYGEDRFVAGGSDANIAYSADGITWTGTLTDGTFIIHTPSYYIGYINSVAYGEDTFVAVGSAMAAYSTDGGVTWIATGNNLSLNIDINDVAYGGGKFVAVGDAYGRIWYSNDQE